MRLQFCCGTDAPPARERLKAESRELVLAHEQEIRAIAAILFDCGSIGREDGYGIPASEIIKNILDPSWMMPPSETL
jgi:hypothetical protein